MEGNESNLDIYEEVHDLVEELTTTSKVDLNSRHMKKLKRLCKNSDAALQHTHYKIMEQLEKPHSEIRYSAFKVLTELFSRSHLFRKLVGNSLCKIFLLTVGTDPVHHPLPRPEEVSKRLKLFVLKTINEWYKKYGTYYRRITLGYEFLRDMKKVNFSVINAAAEEEKRKQREKIEKEEKRVKSKLQQVDIQVYDMYDDIIKNVKEIENIFHLFLPKVEKARDDNTDEPTNHENENLLNTADTTENENEKINFEDLDIGTETGIQGNYSVTIEISNNLEVIEDETNTDLIKRMDELHTEIYQQQTIVKGWLRTLVKYKSADKKKAERILNLQNMLSTASKKYLEIKITRLPGCKDDDDDEDFVDVPEKIPGSEQTTVQKADSKPKIKAKPVQSKATSTSKQPSNQVTNYMPTQPTNKQTADHMVHPTSTITEKAEQDIQQTDESANLSRKERLMKIAPVVPYDVDLQYWGKEVKPIASIKLDSQHRFWKTNEHVEEFVPPDVVESMRTRVMQFPVKFVPVDRACGARLPSGKLCERMDRYKCPFHGKIIERDKQGIPVDPEQRACSTKELKVEEEDETKEEKDDIKKEKGYVPFGMEPYKKKRKTKSKMIKEETNELGKKKTQAEIKAISKKRYARLSDIKVVESSKTRLEKKVCSQGSIKKINASLDATMKKKQLGKFGDNFNYY